MIEKIQHFTAFELVGFIMCCIIGVSIILFFITAPLYCKFGIFKKFYHDLLWWHEPDDEAEMEFDGLNLITKCKYCGEEIMQDSQGNWF